MTTRAYFAARIKAAGEQAKEDDEQQSPCLECDGSLLVVAPSGHVIDCPTCKRRRNERMDRMHHAELEGQYPEFEDYVRAI